MFSLALLPASADLALDGIRLDDSSVTVRLRTTAPTACCPACGQPSRHVHSRYVRRLKDLPAACQQEGETDPPPGIRK